MKVLVIGTQGQLARSLSERSPRDASLTLVCVGRPELDLASPSTILPALERIAPAIVVNAAAYTDVERAETDAEMAHRVNAEGVEALAMAARKSAARLIHISTDFVFDGSKSTPYVEDDRPNPVNTYGASKLAGEIAVRRTHPEHVILRTSWVYSPFGKNFLTTMLSLAATRTELSVVADQTGTPTSALDLADAIFAVANRWKSEPACGLGQTFHCAGSDPASWFDFATNIFAESRRHQGPAAELRPIPSAEWPSKVRRPSNSVLDSSRFNEAFGSSVPGWRHSLKPIVARRVSETCEHAL